MKDFIQQAVDMKGKASQLPQNEASKHSPLLKEVMCQIDEEWVGWALYVTNARKEGAQYEFEKVSGQVR